MPASQYQSPVRAQASAPNLILLIVNTCEKNCLPLRRMAAGLGWELLEAASCAEALTLLRQEYIPVVVCEQDLPDGNWRLLLEEMNKIACQPSLIVASRLADERLWVEALSRGAYDLLSLPYDTQEVRRIVSLAWAAKRREAVKEARKPPRLERSLQSPPHALMAAFGA